MVVLFILVTLAVLMIASFAMVRRSEQRFLEKWPPIDDDEFVRRCPPGTRRETALTVRRIVAKQLGLPYDNIYPEQRFAEDLGAD